MKTSIKPCLFICFFYGTGFFASAEREDNIGSFTSARHTVKISKRAFHFRGLRFPRSARIKLRQNKVDISALIPALEQVKKSRFDNFSILEETTFPEISKKISELCERSTSPSECEAKGDQEVRENLDRISQEMGDYILYPEEYEPIHKKWTFFNDRVLDSSCANNCSNAGLILAVRRNKGRTYSKVYDQIKDAGQSCQITLLGELAKFLMREEFPIRCLEKKNKQHHPVCKSLHRDLSVLRERIWDIAELAHGPDIRTTTEARAVCLGCTIAEMRQHAHFNLLGDIIERARDHSVCSDPKPGENKAVNYCRKLLINSCRFHNVKREQDGVTYSLPLKLKFTAGKNYDGTVPRNQVPSHYMKKVQRCIAKANTKFLGPNGEKLKIIIQEPTEQDSDRCSREVHKVNIASKHARSNAGNYEADIDCPTITHEVLHLLGLCDEYRAHDMPFACRVVNTNSIMSDHIEKWDNVFKRGQSASLLTPAQFNHILYGSCQHKNKSFRECSDLAYEPSSSSSDCMEKKRQCEAQNVMVSGGIQSHTQSGTTAWPTERRTQAPRESEATTRSTERETQPPRASGITTRPSERRTPGASGATTRSTERETQPPGASGTTTRPTERRTQPSRASGTTTRPTEHRTQKPKSKTKKKGFWERLSSKENIPKNPDTGKRYKSWREYHKDRERRELENSK